jgi:small multidrug resistance pump
MWSGIGIVLTVILGAVLWREEMDWARGIGIALVLGGILTINLFSKAAVH